MDIDLHKPLIIWDKAVKEIKFYKLETGTPDRELPEWIFNNPCIDSRFVDRRYGIYEGNYRKNTWINYPFDRFPIEFKTQLLLLGIK